MQTRRKKRNKKRSQKINRTETFSVELFTGFALENNFLKSSIPPVTFAFECWTLPAQNGIWQHVKLSVCDEKDVLQKLSWQDGKLHVQGEKNFHRELVLEHCLVESKMLAGFIQTKNTVLTKFFTFDLLLG